MRDINFWFFFFHEVQICVYIQIDLVLANNKKVNVQIASRKVYTSGYFYKNLGVCIIFDYCLVGECVCFDVVFLFLLINRTIFTSQSVRTYIQWTIE